MVLGIEPRTLYMLDKYSTNWAISPAILKYMKKILFTIGLVEPISFWMSAKDVWIQILPAIDLNFSFVFLSPYTDLLWFTT